MNVPDPGLGPAVPAAVSSNSYCFVRRHHLQSGSSLTVATVGESPLTGNPCNGSLHKFRDDDAVDDAVCGDPSISTAIMLCAGSSALSLG